MEFWHFHINWRLIKTDTYHLALTRKHQVVPFKGSWPKVELTAKRKELAQRNKTYIVKLWLWNTWFGFFRILETRKQIQKKPQCMHTLTPINLPIFISQGKSSSGCFIWTIQLCAISEHTNWCAFSERMVMSNYYWSHISSAYYISALSFCSSF